ncbi:MAG: hypothetical protein GY939_04500 [Actinomycetia bacterium]|nr:hypothetical protein [Actinomycetes bacterium]
MVIGLGGLGLLALIAWLLLGPTEATTPDSDPEELAGVGDTVADPQDLDDEVVATSPTSLPLLTIERRPLSEPGQATLGGPVGFSLLVGSDSGPLSRLDLDRGEWTEYEATGSPVLSTGEWLVVSRVEGRATHAVRLDDPDGDERALGSVREWPLAVSYGPEPDQVWVLVEEGAQGFQWQLIDLDDGSIERTVPFGQSEVEAGSFQWIETTARGGLTPEVATSDAGGVFVLEGESYRRVSDGSLLWVTDDYVLTQTCSQPTVCTLLWLSRHDFSPVDRFVPLEQVDVVTFVSPGGRVFGYFGSRSGGMVDIERGVTILFGVLGRHVAVSPDERYVATDLAGGYAITDLDTGDEFRVVVAGSLRRQALFIDN